MINIPNSPLRSQSSALMASKRQTRSTPLNHPVEEDGKSSLETTPSDSEPERLNSKPSPSKPKENYRRHPDPKNAKKKKVESEIVLASDDSNRKMFQRIFSDEDEVLLLEGILEFRSATGGDDPYRCADAFHDFIMKRSKGLSFEPSVVQLKEKVRKLRKKFVNNAMRGKHGEPPKFSKTHDQIVFELSRTIWGEGAVGGGVNNGGDDGKVELEAGKANVDALDSLIKWDKALGDRGLGVGEGLLRKGDALMESSKRAKLEGEWRILEAAEADLRVTQVELYAEHAKMALQAIKDHEKLGKDR